jgi:large subunit ribosomal protein L10
MRPEKTQLLNDIKDELAASGGFFLVSYKGLEAETFAELRGVLARNQSVCRVVPNRILARAVREVELLGDAAAVPPMIGDTAVVTAGEDLIETARALRDFGRRHEFLQFKLGVLEGKACDAAQARSLADLPAREVLLAQLLGLMQAGPGRLVQVLNAKCASILNVLQACLRKKEEAEGQGTAAA